MLAILSGTNTTDQGISMQIETTNKHGAHMMYINVHIQIYKELHQWKTHRGSIYVHITSSIKKMQQVGYQQWLLGRNFNILLNILKELTATVSSANIPQLGDP